MASASFTGGNNTPCRSDQIKDFSTAGIPDSLSYYMTPAPLDDPGMSICCGGANIVHRNTDCTVWCEIPRDFFTANSTSPSPRKSVGATVDFAFDTCRRHITGDRLFTVAYVHLNEADRAESAAAVGPAAAPGLGRVLLMAGVVVYLALF